MTARTLNELRDFKLEPGASAFAAHLVHALRGDRAQLLFMHLHPAVRFGLRRRNAGAYLSADRAKLVRAAGPLAHDQSPLCSCFARAGGVTAGNRIRQLRRDSLSVH